MLSGGERRRLALALVVASGANLLVLDEPTNHLDLESREALEAALEAFPGTVLLVSHDRAVLDAVPDRIVAVEDLTLRSYDGGWADLVRSRARRQRARRLPPARLGARSRSRSRSRGDRRSSTGSRSGSPSSSSASRSSRPASPRAGRTWMCLRPTPRAARSSTGSWRAGRSCFAEAQAADAATRAESG